MKKTAYPIKSGIAVLMVLLCSSCSLLKQSAEKSGAIDIRSIAESRHYSISFNQMIPLQGAAQHLTSDYFLKISGDSVYSYLPYYGRAYSVPYGGGKVLHFESVITQYNVQTAKSGNLNITFRTKTEEDSYNYRIDLSDNGSAALSVSSNNRQAITFYGELVQ